MMGAALVGGLLGLAGIESTAFAQAVQPAAPPAALPEPIYWKQQLFLIPYQWGSAAEPGAAQAVWLFLSKDRGASWQKISEAKPDVKAFNYRAEGDGEYWFAVRTFDKQGRAWPQGPYQPELRVIVDTTLPRIDELRASAAENGSIEIHARVADSNLDPTTWKIEWQAQPAGAWQPATLQGATVQAIGNTGIPLGGSAIHALWQPPAGTRPVAIRGVVMDRAGNSATYQARLDGALAVSGPVLSSPAISTVAALPSAPTVPTQQAFALPNPNALQATSAANGWVSAGDTSASAAPNAPSAQSGQGTVPLSSQPWPAANATRAPFQLWTAGTPAKDDGVTAYGSPQLFAAPPASVARTEPMSEAPRVEARYAGISKPQSDSAYAAVPTISGRPQFTALEPYRESAATPPVMHSAAPAPAPVPASNPTVRDVTPIDSQSSPHSPPSSPKLVGSRTFALEYDLEETGRGVSKVELWGSRDGGKLWTCYAQDDDNRSPLIVTVDEEGLYGFRIVVQNAGGPAAETPRTGDSPELWVSVDLKRPVVELTTIERGQGNVADHLILHWRAADNNLEPRPVGLFYSSRPTGPWSAIATNLENTGEYAWRVERYVPARFYLRIEARDTAGNLAAFQTREPVEFSPASLAGRLRSAER